MKEVLIIGLGKFGRYTAKKFHELGNHIMVLDTNEDKVNEILPYVTNAQIGDSTQPAVLESLGLNNFDICIVCVSDNFQVSLETTSLLKEGGARYVIARATTEIQAKFLRRNGADEVVFAEKQIAERIAMKYGSNNIFDCIQLNNEYSIYEIQPPKAWIGKTLLEANVRQKYNMNILGIKIGNDLNPFPNVDHIFTTQERLMVLCRSEDIENLKNK